MLLPVQVTYRNMTDSTGLEEIVRKEVAKLEHFYDRITSCRVMVERPQRGQAGKLYHVRIDLRLPNGELVVKHTPTLHGTLKDFKTDKTRKEADSVLVHKLPQSSIHQAFREMRRQLQDYSHRQDGFVKALTESTEGEVKSIFPKEGYGFLKAADESEIYFTKASVLDGHFARLRSGTRVRYVEELGDKGPQASSVAVIQREKQARTAAESVPLPRKRTAAKARV